MKLPSSKGGVITIKADQRMARKGYESSLKNLRGAYAINIQEGEPGWFVEADVINERRPGPVGEV